MHEKCPSSELFWSVFSYIGTQYGEKFRISPHSVQMQENTVQNNFEYGHFLRNDSLITFLPHGDDKLDEIENQKISMSINEFITVNNHRGLTIRFDICGKPVFSQFFDIRGNLGTVKDDIS